MRLDPLNLPAIRKNHGAWDGLYAFESRRFAAWTVMDEWCARHFDKVYAGAFRKGWEAARAKVSP
jgi:hypothetical protein